MDQAQPLFFSFDYPPLGGGVARLCSEIVMQAKAHEGVQFRVLTGGEERRPWRELKAFRALTSINSAEFCICGLWYPEGLIATLANFGPRVILAHGSELMPTRQVWRRWVWKRLQDFVLSRADLIVANSHYTAELVRSGSPKAKVVAIPLAVDPDLFAPGSKTEARQKLGLPDKKFIITTVARLRSYKGLDTVIQALGRMPDTVRGRFHYVVVGSGPDRERLEKMAADLGVSSMISWLGFVDDRALPDVYRASDLFVLCTRENFRQREVEGFGLVFLEAQSCGTPVIGARSGGIPDAVVDGQGGWLIPPDDSEELARRLLWLEGDVQLMEKQRVLARERVLAGCTWRHYVHQLVSALKSNGVLKSPASP